VTRNTSVYRQLTSKDSHAQSLVLPTHGNQFRNYSQERRAIGKYLTQLYIFVWGVLIIGALFSFLTSTVARTFLVSHVWWLILFAIGIAAVKQYLIGLWFRRRTLEVERKHLKHTLEGFTLPMCK
jgi:hypothetical protein